MPSSAPNALIRLALAGDVRATDTTLCNCHWQLLDFDSLRGAPPPREGFGGWIVTGGNPSVIPGTNSELVGADALIGPMGNVLKPKWDDEGVVPYRWFSEVPRDSRAGVRTGIVF